MRLEETEQASEGNELLVLYCSRNETEYRAKVVMPVSPERVAEIQNELSELLYSGSESGR